MSTRSSDGFRASFAVRLTLAVATLSFMSAFVTALFAPITVFFLPLVLRPALALWLLADLTALLLCVIAFRSSRKSDDLAARAKAQFALGLATTLTVVTLVGLTVGQPLAEAAAQAAAEATGTAIGTAAGALVH